MRPRGYKNLILCAAFIWLYLPINAAQADVKNCDGDAILQDFQILDSGDAAFGDLFIGLEPVSFLPAVSPYQSKERPPQAQVLIVCRTSSPKRGPPVLP